MISVHNNKTKNCFILSLMCFGLFYCFFLCRSVRFCLTSLIWTFSIWAWIRWRAPAWSLGVPKLSQASAASSSTTRTSPGTWCTCSRKRSLSKCVLKNLKSCLCLIDTHLSYLHSCLCVYANYIMQYCNLTYPDVSLVILLYRCMLNIVCKSYISVSD